MLNKCVEITTHPESSHTCHKNIRSSFSKDYHLQQ